MGNCGFFRIFFIKNALRIKNINILDLNLLANQ